MAQSNKTWFAAGLVALLFLGAQACSGSDFAGGSGKSVGLTGGGKGGKDGDDSGPGADGADGADGPDGGGLDGDDSGGPDSGGVDGDDSGGGKDGKDSGSEGDDSGGTDDGEVSAKTRHDATISRGEKDNPFELKIETIVKGKTASTQTLTFSGDGSNDPTVAKLVCRNNKDTCLKLTFTNLSDDEKGHVEVVGGTPGATTTCAWAQENGKTAIVDVDVDGDEQSGIFDMGTCKAEDTDDQITITCPQSKKLNVQLCTGE